MGFSVIEHLKMICDYFDRDKADEAELKVVYEIHDSGDQNGTWTVCIKDGTCALQEGESEGYDTKLTMTAEVYERMVTGKLDVTRLSYLTGAVRYTGNTLGHRELLSYLTIPQDVGVVAL